MKKNSNKDITAVLSEVASDVVGQLDLDKLLPKILDTTMRTLNAEVCSIFLNKENDPNIIRCVAGSGFAKNIVGIAEYKIGEGFTGTVALGQSFNIKNREELEALAAKKQWIGKFDKEQWRESGGITQYKNGIALPLKIKDQILGVIKVENKINGDYFTDEEEIIFKTVANVIALAIENAKSHQKAEEQSKAISKALSDVASAVVGSLSMSELLDKIINTTMKTLGAEVCSIFLEDEEKPGIIKCVAGSGFAKNIVGIAEYKIGEGLTGAVAQGESFHIRSRKELEKEIKNNRWKGKYDYIQFKSPSGTGEFRNLLAYPLKISDRILGVVKVENKNGGDFTNNDELIFQIIANVIALTIEKATLQQKTEKQLKTISAKAAHRINNQVTNYDAIELDLGGEITSLSPNVKNIFPLLTRLKDTTINLKRMISEFTEFGKPLKLKKELGDINEIIRSEVNQFQSNSLKITLTTDSNIPQFYFDKARFAESIKELLRNSIRAIETAKIADGKIEISTYYKDGRAIIKIEDNGPGIPEEIPIFTPFHSTHPQGTGLGLATVKELVEAHKGTIDNIIGPESGACFEIVIPVVLTKEGDKNE